MWEGSLHLFWKIGVWPAFVALAWMAYRRGGWRPLLALWIGASLAYGYASYRLTCAQGLTCDVGGTSPWFVSGTPYYFTHYVPLFTGIGLAAFGAGSLVVVRMADDGPRRTIALGTLAAFGGWIAAVMVAGTLFFYPS